MKDNQMNQTVSVLHGIYEERLRQDQKWGVQTHLHTHPSLLEAADPEKSVAEFYDVPTETEVKLSVETAVKQGDLTWGDILLEEVVEALTVRDNKALLRKELVQVAAVATAWIEQIDRESKE